MKTFKHGGIHPLEHKLSSSQAIEKLSLPERVTLPLSQHIGAPSVPIVKVGDEVKVGTKLTEPKGLISAAIHSSVSGVVEKIEDLLDASGYRRPMITIKVTGDEWLDSIDKSPEIIRSTDLDSASILQKILDAGIVGLGGATFPTTVKLAPPPSKKAEYLLINGVECEPYLTSDHRLMLEKGEEILIGILLAAKLLNPSRIIIGIEANKTDAISHLKKLTSLDPYKKIEVEALKVQYPQGAEKQLIEALAEREVPPGKLPIDIGCVVQNVGTLFAIYEAVLKNKPLFERVVTVTGTDLEKRGNFLVRLGTSVTHLLDAVGGLPENTEKIISGGPMMGKALLSTDIPITKGTSGITLLPKELASRGSEQNCIRCARCLNACPLHLEPYLFAALSKKSRYEELEHTPLMDCCECGSCSFVCPSHIPLLDHIRNDKIQLNKILRARKG